MMMFTIIKFNRIVNIKFVYADTNIMFTHRVYTNEQSNKNKKQNEK